MGANQNAINQVKELNLENLDYTRIPIQVDDILIKIKLHLQVYSLKKQFPSQKRILKQEISLRKKVEDELKQYKSMLENLMENLPGIVYHSSSDFNLMINFLSDNCYSFTGYQSEELIQNRITYNQLIHPEDRLSVSQQRQKALAKNQPFQLVYRMITANNELKWVWEQCDSLGRNRS